MVLPFHRKMTTQEVDLIVKNAFATKGNFFDESDDEHPQN